MGTEETTTRGLPGLFHLTLVLVLAAAACSSPGAPPSTSLNTATRSTQSSLELAPRQPVIVDYSPTVSDAGALLYLLSHSNVEVVAITVPVTGEAGCELGVEVTLGILALLGREEVPVACDPEPAESAKEWPAEFLTGQESLLFGLPDVSAAGGGDRPAYELIAEVAAASDRPVILYAVAPLTNVARALELRLDVAGQLDRIVIMGGAVDARGNVEGTNAEWNIWIDVPAAARVLASEVPITLVPLDATDDVPVPAFWQSDLKGAEQSEAVKYLTSLVQIFPAVTGGFFYLWDELAASVAAGQGLVTTEHLNLAVVTEPGPTYGSTVRDPTGARVLMATAVPDPASFYAHFVTTLAGEPIEARTSLLFDETSPPASVTSSSSPAQVLVFWLFQAAEGNVDAAASIVAPDAAWVGFGASPDSFVEGSEPYAAFDVELTCISDETVAVCDMTWNDLWITAIPDLERGGLQAQAEVINGMIVAFQTLALDGNTGAAFRSHTAWLEAEQPERLEQACAADPAARDCSELYVTTVADWVASR